MYGEDNPGLAFGQGVGYSVPSDYGYYCAGLDSPGEWEENQYQSFGLDGTGLHYTATQSDGIPYLYYSPSHAYKETQYNPYNPYIPGAALGIDGSYAGAHQYFTVPPYQDLVPSPSYYPIVIQPDVLVNLPVDSVTHAGTSVASRIEGIGSESNHPSLNNQRAATSSAHDSGILQSSLLNEHSTFAAVGSDAQSLARANVPFGNNQSLAPSYLVQNRRPSVSSYPVDSLKKVASYCSQSRTTGSKDFSDLVIEGQPAVNMCHPEICPGRTSIDAAENMGTLMEQNRGPRTQKARWYEDVKSYATKGSGHGGDRHSVSYELEKLGFPLDYANAKFFVIKSYSEDDVHKSIKYEVWSSTPHGNKKLQCAYEDAQRLAARKSYNCPIFLFFSVNTSGQFCGVAEMVGPVDFYKDMDFWQQDKWNGSFPVKWHFIKDVPNTILRHIILENNENKPVTNSRDTQEIPYKQGLEMLRIFKNYASETSLIDDFMYYDGRQKIMSEERSKFEFRGIKSPATLGISGSSNSLYEVAQVSRGQKNAIENRLLSSQQQQQQPQHQSEVKSIENNSSKRFLLDSDIAVPHNLTEKSAENMVRLNDGVGSLSEAGCTSNVKQRGHTNIPAVSTSGANLERNGFITIGSIPIKINGFTKSSSLLRVGAIPINPKIKA